MQLKLKHITGLFIGKQGQVGMKNRVFNLVTVFFGFAALVDAIVEFYIGLSPRVYLFGLLVAAFTTIFYTYNRRYKNYQVMVWPLMILGYVIVGYHWYFSGGFIGSAPLLALGFIAVIGTHEKKTIIHCSCPNDIIAFAIFLY